MGDGVSLAQRAVLRAQFQRRPATAPCHRAAIVPARLIRCRSRPNLVGEGQPAPAVAPSWQTVAAGGSSGALDVAAGGSWWQRLSDVSRPLLGTLVQTSAGVVQCTPPLQW